ncbi:MAG: hypothetical protein AAFU66_04700 [Pseudomonadota bacterium]
MIRTFRRAELWPLSLSLSLLAGCTGGTSSTSFSSNGSGGGSGVDGDAAAASGDAQAFFDASVKSFVQEKCFNCHGGGAPSGPAILGSSPNDMYAALSGNPLLIGATPQESLFLTKGAHAGPAFSPEETAELSTFISLLAESGGGGGGPAVAVDSEKMRGCISEELLEATEVDNLANKNAGGLGACPSCHSSELQEVGGNELEFIRPGTSGFCVEENDERQQFVLGEAACLSKFGFTIAGGRMAANEVPSILSLALEVQQCGANLGCRHPVFNMNDDERQGYLQFLEEVSSCYNGEI